MPTKTKLEQEIYLDGDLLLRYQEPNVFNQYLSVYHGQKYAHYYFRKSPATIKEAATIFDCGYYIYKNNKIIGGVFIKPNFMSDLFVVPPYNDIEYLAGKLLVYLKKISKEDKPILIREVVEEHVGIYESLGCLREGEGYWMTRPTDQLEVNIPTGYESRAIEMRDQNDIAEVIMAAYKNNPCMTVDSKERYLKHVENFIKKWKDYDVIYNSSKVVIHKETNKTVGACLHMEFEHLPLIMSFAVHPDHQGKGVGSYLLRHSINYTHKKYSATRLYVDQGNQAMNIYQHLGFMRSHKIVDLHVPND